MTLKVIAEDRAQKEGKKIFLLSQSIMLGNKPIKGAFFSSDNLHFVALSGDSSLSVYRTQNGKRQRVISSQEQKAISMVLHPGGKLVITGGQDETIRIWDIQQTVAKGVLRGHLGAVSRLSLDISGEILASGSLDGTLVLWKMKDQEMLKSLKIFNKGSIKGLAFSPQENILAVGGEDGSLQFRSVPELKLVSTLPSHKSPISSVEFNIRGDIFVSGSKDGKLIVWDWKNKKKLSIIEFEDAITDLKIHPKREEIAVGTTGGNLEIWSLSKGQKIYNIKKFKSGVTHLAYDNNGQRIISALENGSIDIWENTTSLHLQTLRGHDRPVESLDFSSDSKRLISSALDKSIRIWELEKKESQVRFDMGTHRVLNVRFVPGRQKFSTAGTDSSVIIWNIKDGSRSLELKFHQGKVNDVNFHPNDPVLLSVGSDKKWAFWNTESGDLLQFRSGHDSQILTSAISPDGKIFATAGSDLSIILWKYPQGDKIIKLTGHTKAVTTVAFSPDGKILASGSQDNKIFLWKLDGNISNTPSRKLEGHGYIINQVLFSKNGKALISISKDKTMRLWEVKSGKMLRIMHGDSTSLVSVALSTNGKLIALSNLKKDIFILKFPNDIPELNETESESLLGEAINSDETQTFEISNKDSDNILEALDDLDGKEKRPMTAEELVTYAVTEKVNLGIDYSREQKRLNQLLKMNNTCLYMKEMENLALQIIRKIPNDLAAYHALVKSSILKKDFLSMGLFVKVSKFAELNNDHYDYLSILEIRNIFDNLQYDIFDKSYERLGNIPKIKLVNCKGIAQPIILNKSVGKLHYPEEFLERITSIPFILDLRDFIELTQSEFQNRMFAEIERVMVHETPHLATRLPMTFEDRANKIPFGTLSINLEKSKTTKNEGLIAFKLRKEDGIWQSYHSDKDNAVMMNLPVGSYYFQVASVIRKTFLIDEGKTYNLSID